MNLLTTSLSLSLTLVAALLKLTSSYFWIVNLHFYRPAVLASFYRCALLGQRPCYNGETLRIKQPGLFSDL